MQFLVIGYDGNDENAMERRLAVRKEHVQTFKANYEAGTFLFGCAILNNEDKMIGSVIICEFESEEGLKENWLNNEPYVIGEVWKTVEIRRVQVPSIVI